MYNRSGSISSHIKKTHRQQSVSDSETRAGRLASRSCNEPDFGGLTLTFCLGSFLLVFRDVLRFVAGVANPLVKAWAGKRDLTAFRAARAKLFE